MAVGEAVGVGLDEGVLVGVALLVGVCEGVTVNVAVMPRGVFVGVAVREGVAEGGAVGTAVAGELGGVLVGMTGVTVASGRVKVIVAVGEPVGRAVRLGVAVGVWVRVLVLVTEGDGVLLDVGVAVGLAVATGVRVGVKVGVGVAAAFVPSVLGVEVAVACVVSSGSSITSSKSWVPSSTTSNKGRLMRSRAASLGASTYTPPAPNSSSKSLRAKALSGLSSRLMISVYTSITARSISC